MVTEMVMDVDQSFPSPTGGLQWHGQPNASFSSGYLVQLPQGYLVQMAPEVVPLWSSPVVEVAVDPYSLPPVNAAHEQQLYCAASVVNGMEMDSIYVSNGAPMYLGSVESQEGVHQLEYHVLPTGAQISPEGAVTLFPQNLGGGLSAKPIAVHACGEMFQGGSILVERDASHALCVSEAQVAVAMNDKYPQKLEEGTPDVSENENSSSDISAQAQRVKACCDGKHGPGMASDDVLPENDALANEATLCMSLADCVQNTLGPESVDFDFSALVEVARCEETCKHTGRKSGSSHFLGVSKHRKSGR